MNDTTVLEKSSFRALEEAREAVITLRTLRPLLSEQDEETLALLVDRELMRDLETSLKEAEDGKLEPISSILK